MWYRKIIACIFVTFVAASPVLSGEIEGIRTPAPLYAGSAKGTLTINGQTFTLKHAYARVCIETEGETEVLLTEKLLPEDALFDRLIALMRKGGTTLRARIVPSANELKGIHLLTSDGFQTSTGGSKYVFKPAPAKPGSIAGMLIGEKQFDDDPSFKISFSASVQQPFALTAKELENLRKSPIGQTVTEFVKAVHSADKQALRQVLSAEGAAKLDEPDAEEGISFLKIMLEKDGQLVEIRPAGKDRLLAIWELKHDSGGTSRTKLNLVKENGTWKAEFSE